MAVLESAEDAREHAAAVVWPSRACRVVTRSRSSCRRHKPHLKLLQAAKPVPQRHAACALWGLCDGKDGVYDKQIAEAGAIPLLIAMLQNDDAETRGFAAACLLCLCKDNSAHAAILESGGAELLQALSYGPATWLRSQVVEMLTLLGTPIPDPDSAPYMPPQPLTPSGGPSGGADGAEEGASPGASPPATGRSGRLTGRQTLSSRQPLSGRGSLTGRSLGASSMYGPGGMNSARPLSGTAKMKFHFFSFQIYGTTGLSGSVLGLHGK